MRSSNDSRTIAMTGAAADELLSVHRLTTYNEKGSRDRRLCMLFYRRGKRHSRVGDAQIPTASRMQSHLVMPQPDTHQNAWLGRILVERYRIVAEMGATSIALTFRAWDLKQDRYAVIKMASALQTHDAASITRSIQQLESACRLSHRGIMPILHIGSVPVHPAGDETMPFLVMPYLAGGNLVQRLAQRKPSTLEQLTGELWTWLPTIAGAIDYVRKHGFTLLDMKASSVIFDGSGMPFLHEFGIADATQRSGLSATTEIDRVSRVPAHLAPTEDASESSRNAAGQLAMVICEQIMARHGLSRGLPVERRVSAAEIALEVLASLRSELPGTFVSTLTTALQRSQVNAFQTLSEMTHATLQDVARPRSVPSPRLLCPDCGQLLGVQPRFAGSPGNCPKCLVPMSIAEDLQTLTLTRDRTPDFNAGPDAAAADTSGRFQKLHDTARIERLRSFGTLVATACVAVLMLTVLTCHPATQSPTDVIIARRAHEPQEIAEPIAADGGSADRLATAASPPTPDARADHSGNASDLGTGNGNDAAPQTLDTATTSQQVAPKPVGETPTRASSPAPLANTGALRGAADGDETERNTRHPTGRETAWTAAPGTIMQASAGIELVLIPSGTIEIPDPSPGKRRLGNRPPLKIVISDPFWFGQTEVTRRQWTDLMHSSPWSKDGEIGDDALPATHVSWAAATAYCGRLSEFEAAAGRLGSHERFALPTEAQWEYVHRSGRASLEPLADGLPAARQRGWFKNNATAPRVVGETAPNRWKIYDMDGNVWEWCSDWYSESFAGGIGPTGPRSGSYRFFFRRVCRGGSYATSGSPANSISDRSGGLEGEQDVGFRVVRVRDRSAGPAPR